MPLSRVSTAEAAFERARRVARGAAFAAAIALVVLASACASTGDQPRPAPPLARPEVEYLRPPTVGAGEVPAEIERFASQAFADLTADPQQLVAVERAILDGRQRFPPSIVMDLLAGQAAFLRGDLPRATGYLQPWIEDHPAYDAAQLLWGRLAELSGDLVGAYRAYAAVSGDVTASRQSRALEAAAVRQAQQSFDAELAGGDPEAAAHWLEFLLTRVPGRAATVDARRRLAAVTGDAAEELDALQALESLAPLALEDETRLADLELDVGDAQQGLDRYEDLAARHPHDEAVLEGRSRARFRWRLQLLPDNVRRLTASPQLTRAEFATLLYWTFPVVRQQQGGAPRIAGDILEHEYKTEVARVLNGGFMQLDRRQHLFGPDRPLQAAEARASILRLLQASAAPVCAGAAADGVSSAERVCETLQACEVMDAGAACLPSAPVSGEEAVDWMQRALSVSG